MAEELVYDPKTKMLIKDTLYEYLYTPVEEHFQKRLDALIQKNAQLYSNTQRRMLFGEDTYEASNAGAYVTPVNFTHPEIKPMMKDFVADRTKLNTKELPYVMGFINQVLNSSNSLKDYFKVFPESVHEPIQELVDKCSCRNETLNEQAIERLKQQNEIPIDLMKTRMVKNLLL